MPAPRNIKVGMDIVCSESWYGLIDGSDRARVELKLDSTIASWALKFDDVYIG